MYGLTYGKLGKIAFVVTFAWGWFSLYEYGWWGVGLGWIVGAFAASVKTDDTLESLGETSWNVEYGTTLIEAVLHGYDTDRPLLNWPDYMVAKVAESVGL